MEKQECLPTIPTCLRPSTHSPAHYHYTATSRSIDKDDLARRGVEEMSGPEGGSSRVLPNARHGELKEAKGRRGGHGEARAGERGPESVAGTGKGRQSARFHGVDHIRARPGRELPQRSFSMPPNSELSPFINLVQEQRDRDHPERIDWRALRHRLLRHNRQRVLRLWPLPDAVDASRGEFDHVLSRGI